MKANIKGIEVDCTSDELLYIINNIDKQKKEEVEVETVKFKTLSKKKIPSLKVKYKDKCKEVANNYILNKEKTMGWHMKKIFGRLPGGTEYKKIRNIIYKLENKSEKKKIVKKEDKRVERGRFLASRSKYLMDTQNLSRENAWGIAANEWKVGRNKQKVKVEINQIIDELPIVIKNPDKNKILFDILKGMVANEGKMTFFNEGENAFQIFDFREWINLCKGIFSMSEEISNYFNVDNKFKLRNEYNQVWVSYGK